MTLPSTCALYLKSISGPIHHHHVQPFPGDEITKGTEANNGDDLQGLAAGNYVVRSPQIISSCIFASSLFYIIGGFLILGHDVDKYDPSSSQLWDQVGENCEIE